MVRILQNNRVVLKILWFGAAGSGKTTTLDTLWKLSKSREDSDYEPEGDLTKIAMASGSTLYFDRTTLVSKKHSKVAFHCFTVAGQKRFSPLRKNIWEGTDGVIFVWDSQKSRWSDNIDSLTELIKLGGDTLIKKIPLIIQLNKQDLENTNTKAEIEEVLSEKKLLYGPEHELNTWNPPIIGSIALNNEDERNVYEIFNALAKRVTIYQVLGNGSAPKRQQVKLPNKVPDL